MQNHFRRVPPVPQTDLLLIPRTFLRLILLRLTRRPVLAHPTPYREYDPATLPAEIVSPPTRPSLDHGPNAARPNQEPILPHMRGSTLRSHLQPLLAALPETHQPHTLSLLPELDAKGYAAEVLSASATLVHVLLLLRWAVSLSGVMTSLIVMMNVQC